MKEFEGLTDREKDLPVELLTLEKIQVLQVTLDAILEKITGIADEVQPALDQVMKHPMMKMLGVKR